MKFSLLILFCIIFGHQLVNTKAILKKVVTVIRHGARTPTDVNLAL